jgi:NADH:ubiquinone oxidoreductase subunit 6 (subunit J)
MDKAGKIVTIVLWVLLIVSAVLVVSLMVNIDEANETDPTMLSWVNTNLIWAYILAVFAAAVALLAGLLHTVTDKKAAKAGIISLVFLGGVVLISYLLASPEIPQFLGVDKFVNDGTLTASIAKMVDTGLYATYILLAIAILSIVFTSVARLFK